MARDRTYKSYVHRPFTHRSFLMPVSKRLSASDVFTRHILHVMLATGFIGVFIISVPIVKMLNVGPEGESLLFGLLFILLHLANWPLLQLRWSLWFRGRLTPYAAWCTTALLLGSFGIPFVLLADLLH